MPLTLDQQVNIAGNTRFQYRVAMAMYTVAKEFITDEDTNTLSDIFARMVIQADYGNFTKYAALVVADSSIAGANITNADSVTDQTILAAIRSMWDYLSGVGSSVLPHPGPHG